METRYADEIEETTGNSKVVFINAEGVRLVRDFDSPFLAEKFARKIKYSKKCRLISTIVRWN